MRFTNAVCSILFGSPRILDDSFDPTWQFLQEYELECAKRGERGPSKKKKLPIVHTRASLGQRYVEPVADDKPTFKLKRFENVKGKGKF